MPKDIPTLAQRLPPDLLADVQLREQFGKRSRQLIAGWSYDQTIQGILEGLEFAVGPRQEQG